MSNYGSNVNILSSDIQKGIRQYSLSVFIVREMESYMDLIIRSPVIRSKIDEESIEHLVQLHHESVNNSKAFNDEVSRICKENRNDSVFCTMMRDYQKANDLYLKYFNKSSDIIGTNNPRTISDGDPSENGFEGKAIEFLERLLSSNSQTYISALSVDYKRPLQKELFPFYEQKKALIVSEFCKCYLDSETKPEMKEVFKAHIKTSLKGKSVDFLQKVENTFHTQYALSSDQFQTCLSDLGFSPTPLSNNVIPSVSSTAKKR